MCGGLAGRNDGRRGGDYREGCLPVAIGCSDEALDIADAHLCGDTERVFRFIEDVMDDLEESTDHLFLSDEYATYAAVN